MMFDGVLADEIFDELVVEAAEDSAVGRIAG
jgi:hypothetical protein